jgi:hypothetical protein
MAASGADIRDILSLPGPSSTPVAPRKVPKAQKPEGISRELYSLIGDHAPSLAAVQRAKPKLKQKPDLGRGRVRWWAEHVDLISVPRLSASVQGMAPVFKRCPERQFATWTLGQGERRATCR